MELSSFEFDVEVKAGAEHGNADALSRRPAEPTRAPEPLQSTPPGTQPAAQLQEVGLKAAAAGALTATSHILQNGPPQGDVDTGVRPDPDCTGKGGAQATVNMSSEGEENGGTRDLRQAQEQDRTFQQIRGWLEKKEKPDRSKMGAWGKVLLPRWEKVMVSNGIIGVVTGEGFRAAVPGELQEEIIRMAHDHATSGHMGRRRTSFRVRQRFIWPGMYRDIREFCDGCIPCQRRQRPSPAKRAPMVTEATSRPFERIAVDVTEMPVSVKGNNCALVIMDYFSKYVRIYPMANQKTETILECLLDWVYDFGVPDRLHSDQGSQFESRLFRAMCERLGIHKTRTTPYHPESDGMVERFNRTLKDMISKYIDAEGLHWDDSIKTYSMAYNSSVHSATGYTPFYLVHGYEPRMPLDAAYGPPTESAPVRSYLEDRLRAMRAAYSHVRGNTTRASRESTERYDRKQCNERYQVGDKVWVRDFRAAVGGKPKLGLPYTGPSTIIGKVGLDGREVVYKVASKDGKVRNLHHNHLKPAKLSNQDNTDYSRKSHGYSRVAGEESPRAGGGERPVPEHPTGCERQSRMLLFVQPQEPAPETPALPAGGVGEDDGNAPVYGPPTPYITRSGRVSRPLVPYPVEA